MTITHKIDQFLLELFPQYKQSNHDLEVLKEVAMPEMLDELGLNYTKEYELATQINNKN